MIHLIFLLLLFSTQIFATTFEGCSNYQIDIIEKAERKALNEIPNIIQDIDDFVKYEQLSGTDINSFNILNKNYQKIYEKIGKEFVICDSPSNEYCKDLLGYTRVYIEFNRKIHLCSNLFFEKINIVNSVAGVYIHEVAHNVGAQDLDEIYFHSTPPQNGTARYSLLAFWNFPVSWQNVADTYSYFFFKPLCVPEKDCVGGYLDSPFRDWVTREEYDNNSNQNIGPSKDDNRYINSSNTGRSKDDGSYIQDHGGRQKI